MKVESRTRTIILLLILIAIGGIVMYGGEKTPVEKAKENSKTPPVIKGPTTPPPSYEALR